MGNPIKRKKKIHFYLRTMGGVGGEMTNTDDLFVVSDVVWLFFFFWRKKTDCRRLSVRCATGVQLFFFFVFFWESDTEIRPVAPSDRKNPSGLSSDSVENRSIKKQQQPNFWLILPPTITGFRILCEKTLQVLYLVFVS